MHEDRHDRVPLPLRIALVHPLGEIDMPRLDLDPALRGERLRLVEGDAGEVEADDVMAALGEPDPVAALAVAEAQHA